MQRVVCHIDHRSSPNSSRRPATVPKVRCQSARGAAGDQWQSSGQWGATRRESVSCPVSVIVFRWVLGRLANEGLLKGNTIGVDVTTLEANAAVRSIVRRDTAER